MYNNMETEIRVAISMGKMIKKECHFNLFLVFLFFALLLKVCHEKWCIVEAGISDFPLLVSMKLGIGIDDKREDSLNNTKCEECLKKINLLSAREFKKVQLLTYSLWKKNLDPNKEDKYGNIRFAGINYSNQLHVEKTNAIKFILENTKTIRHFLRDKNALIKLKNDKDNLATVVVVGGQVQLTLSPWFFETQSVGKIVGIIAHEFAVHPLASERLTDCQRKKEIVDKEVKIRKKINLNDNSIFYDENNNTDHLFAASKGSARYEIYQQTVYEMAVVMLRNTDKISCINERVIIDLIFSYFSDMATILATNDHKDKAVERLGRVATYFNSLRNDWLVFLIDKEGGILLSKLVPKQQRGERDSLLEDFISSVTLRFKQK
jgi:hypothetical protein